MNYQRALEGELSTIETIGPVKGARHLAMPKPSLFVREQNSRIGDGICYPAAH